jgi:hypothetical protein
LCSLQICDEGVIALADAIRSHPTLTVLNLSANRVSDTGYGGAFALLHLEFDTEIETSDSKPSVSRSHPTKS